MDSLITKAKQFWEWLPLGNIAFKVTILIAGVLIGALLSTGANDCETEEANAVIETEHSN